MTGDREPELSGRTTDHTAHDDDTGPVSVSDHAPRPSPGPWAAQPGAAGVGPARADRRRVLLIGGVGVALLAVIAGVVVWTTRSSETSGSAQPGSADESGQAPDAGAAVRLKRLIPVGYPPDACTSVSPPDGVSARLDCTKNADPGGPGSASYFQENDRTSLSAAFDAYVRGMSVVNCPRNMQSPGPWRRNATPRLVSGTLVCGFRDNQPTLAWTDDVPMVLSTVQSGAAGPSLEQLYDWWSTHS